MSDDEHEKDCTIIHSEKDHKTFLVAKDAEDAFEQSGFNVHYLTPADLDTSSNKYLESIQLIYFSDVVFADITDIFFRRTIFYHLQVRASLGRQDKTLLMYLNSAGSTFKPDELMTYTTFGYYFDQNAQCLCMHTRSSLNAFLLNYIPSSFAKLEEETYEIYKKKWNYFLYNYYFPALDSSSVLSDLQSIELRILERRPDFVVDAILTLLTTYHSLKACEATLELLKKCEDDESTEGNLNHLSCLSLCLEYKAFALNRLHRSAEAKEILVPIVNSANCSPDSYGIMGRICKDLAINWKNSGFVIENEEMLNEAIEWYGRGYDLNRAAYPAINYATLCVVAGKGNRFSEKVGKTIQNEMRNGALYYESKDYWKLATSLEAFILYENWPEACTCWLWIFQLALPPGEEWKILSTVQNLRLILNSKKNVPELFQFWMEFFTFDPAHGGVDGEQIYYFPVVENFNQDFRPGRLQLSHDANGAFTLQNLLSCVKEDCQPICECGYSRCVVKTRDILAINPIGRDPRCCFMSCKRLRDPFEIYFSNEQSRLAFQGIISTMLGNLNFLDRSAGMRLKDIEFAVDDNKQVILLGRGNQAEVYKARCGELPVAVKVIRCDENERKGEWDMLVSEIRTFCALDHRNIVKYHGANLADDKFVIIMELVCDYGSGGSLAELCSLGAFEEHVIALYIKQILEGLVYLHASDIMHRDIKGSNILINGAGVVKLADFGSSKRLQGGGRTNSLAGTLSFMAPEVASGLRKTYTFAADIWSVGCTFIEMATGQPPFQHVQNISDFMTGVDFKPDIPSHLSESAKDFVSCCLKSEDERSTAAELLKHPFLQREKVKPLRSSSFDGSSMDGTMEPLSPQWENALRKVRSQKDPKLYDVVMKTLRRQTWDRISRALKSEASRKECVDLWFDLVPDVEIDPLLPEILLLFVDYFYKYTIDEDEIQLIQFASATKTLTQEEPLLIATVQKILQFFNQIVSNRIKEADHSIEPHWLLTISKILTTAQNRAIKLLGGSLKDETSQLFGDINYTSSDVLEFPTPSTELPPPAPDPSSEDRIISLLKLNGKLQNENRELRQMIKRSKYCERRPKRSASAQSRRPLIEGEQFDVSTSSPSSP